MQISSSSQGLWTLAFTAFTILVGWLVRLTFVTSHHVNRDFVDGKIKDTDDKVDRRMSALRETTAREIREHEQRTDRKLDAIFREIARVNTKLDKLIDRKA